MTNRNSYTIKREVSGGWVVREAQSGQFVSVTSSGKTTKSSRMTEIVVKETSSKRSDALKRLANK